MRYFTKPILAQLITMEVLFFLIAGVCYLIWPTSMESAFLPLFVFYPLVALFIPLYSVASRGFTPVWPWATFVLFLPPMFTLYNSTAMFYAVVYTVITAIGCMIGVGIHRGMTKGRRDVPTTYTANNLTERVLSKNDGTDET